MANQERDVGGQRYLIEKLGLFRASDLARTWSYALIMLSKAPEDLKAQDFGRAFPTFLPYVSREENDFALSTCLGAVKRAVGGDRGWAPVVSQTGQIMFEDITLMQMYELVFHVLDVNELLHFFGDPLEASSPTGGADVGTNP